MVLAERMSSEQTSNNGDFSIQPGHGHEVKCDIPRFLLIPPIGIGDAVAVASCTADQIIKIDPTAYGKIDILCNNVQSELFQHDPRINRIILPHPSLLPTIDRKTWMKALFLDSGALSLSRFLRDRNYEAVLPGIVAPVFYSRLHAPLMPYDVFRLAREFLTHRSSSLTHISVLMRNIVNHHFALPTKFSTHTYEDVPLYITSTHLQKARLAMESLKVMSSVPADRCKVMLVAPDTSSIITRPPTSLLADGISAALREDESYIVGILPSYTDASSSVNLYQALSSQFEGRVLLMHAHPRPTLLETCAFIDQADVFITGDTGVMHLTAALKKVREDDDWYKPRNRVKMIALFGGTNPSFYGYATRSTILGRGRKEQDSFRPGIIKEYYNTRGKDFFDHITPYELTKSIL
jgi:ADP-heptose:LPS heptosyltransferase